MNIQLSFGETGTGIFVNERGDLCSAKDGTEITRFFLEVALRYRSDVAIMESLGITRDELDYLKEELGITIPEEKRLNDAATLRILDTVDKHMDKYGFFPQVSYLRRRTKFDRTTIEQELNRLIQFGFVRPQNANQHQMIA